MSVVIGIYPDSENHGVAIYRDAVLVELCELPLMELLELAKKEKPNCLLFSIENVMANKFMYARNVHGNSRVQSKVAMAVGRNMQSQVELMRGLDCFGVIYELHKPTSRNWSKRKPEFERITSWSKRSNEDTRSAAFFGHRAASRIALLQRVAND